MQQDSTRRHPALPPHPAGIPVFARDNEGNRELITHNVTGLLLPESPTAAVAQIVAALDSGHASAMAARAKEAVARDHSSASEAASWASLLGSVYCSTSGS